MLKSMRSYVLLLVASFVLVSLGGCPTPPKPQNVEQTIAYTYTAHSTATNGVTELLRSGKISIESAENALVISKQVKVGLDLAQKLAREGKPTDALATLKMAQTTLDGLRQFVEISEK